MNVLHVWAIIKKDVDIDLRQKYAVAGIFLFAVSSTFIIYKAFGTVTDLEWNILVWIIALYAGLNAIVKSFVQERKETYLYYYTLFDPLEVILGKLIYNYFFMLFISIVITTVFSILLGSPIQDYWTYGGGMALGMLGISSVYTFVSSVSAASSGNSILMSILALPLVLPSVLLLEKISAVSMRLITDSDVTTDFYILAGIDVLLIGMIVLIFPELWKS